MLEQTYTPKSMPVEEEEAGGKKPFFSLLLFRVLRVQVIYRKFGFNDMRVIEYDHENYGT